MEFLAVIAGIVAIALAIAVPLSMIILLVYVRQAQRHEIITTQTSKIGIVLSLSHFPGFAVFIIANGIPAQWELFRLSVAACGIILLGIVPTALCILLATRRLFPQKFHPYLWLMAGSTILLSLILSFGVWITISSFQAMTSVFS